MAAAVIPSAAVRQQQPFMLRSCLAQYLLDAKRISSVIVMMGDCLTLRNTSTPTGPAVTLPGPVVHTPSVI
jgi:hypothetical protein